MGEVERTDKPFGPNELAEDGVYYPDRFDMAPLGEIEKIRVSEPPKALHEAIRRRIASGCADTIRLSPDDLRDLLRPPATSRSVRAVRPPST